MKKIISTALLCLFTIGGVVPSFAVDQTEKMSETMAVESQETESDVVSESQSNNWQSSDTSQELNQLVTESSSLIHDNQSKAETSQTAGTESDHSLEKEEELVPPTITEENQHILGHTSKGKSRQFQRLDWNSQVLPRADFIDISSHQGNMSVADFTNLKKYGVTGVMVKLTEATSYRNPFAPSQIANAKKAGMKISVYHYSWFSTKKTAEAEADYFISYAEEIGLDSSVVMVNDIEQEDIKYLSATANSIYFANRLLAKQATKKVVHYSSLSWFLDKTLDEAKLGGPQSVWLAQYPYNPDKNHLLHQDKAAWQWASDLIFPGDRRQFDVNIDYTGLFSTPKTEGMPGPALAHDKYVKIVKAGYTIWSDFNWKYRSSSDNYLNQVLLAKVKYKHSNGSTYYSLYDKNGKWHGYLNSAATQPSGDEGVYIPVGKHVQVTAKNYTIWSSFNWQERSDTTSRFQRTYLAKGMYRHRNGATYYSLYDSRGGWHGYLNAEAVKMTEKQGQAIVHNEYVKVIRDDYTLWNNFDWQERQSSKDFDNKVFKSQVKYHHVNGDTYYSLYDATGKWQGYINKNGTQTVPEGPYLDFGKRVKISAKNYTIWSNFNWQERDNTTHCYQNIYTARGMYKHRNGATYYSLYDNQGKWHGYLNAEATTVI